MSKYPHDTVVALIVKYALDMGMLDSKENIKLTDDWLKSVLHNNSLITKTKK